MATVDFIPHKHNNVHSMRRLINYVSREDKAIYQGQWLVAGIDCDASDAYDDFMYVKTDFDNLDGRAFYHLYQSFHPDEQVTPQQAHELALGLAEYYKGFQVLVATHVDNDHLHSHLVVNSVNFETGKKLRSKKDALVELRALSDRLCKEQGLSVLAEYTGEYRKDILSGREYRSAVKTDSWKFQIIRAIDDALMRSRTKDEFIENMEYEGIRMTWTPERKYITFITADGKRCRDYKLHDEAYLKDNLEQLFAYREEYGFIPFRDEPEDGWLSEFVPQTSSDDITPESLGDPIWDLLRLGKDIENIPDDYYGKPLIIHEDHRKRRREKIKQLASGHKLKDELDEEQYSEYK